jgi:predicted molibdopterin-dependent oxidoreductase YjgC
MFSRLPDVAIDAVPVTIDGTPFVAHAADTVASAMLAAGRLDCRTTPVSGVARGPYCMMGACFDCLVTIDGRPNQQGCLVPVAPGMRIETQRGVRRVAGDEHSG